MIMVKDIVDEKYASHFDSLQKAFRNDANISFIKWFENTTNGKLCLTQNIPRKFPTIYDIDSISFEKELDYQRFLLTWG
jgi:hypothetical protein